MDRPLPPEHLHSWGYSFEPAHDLLEWIRETYLKEEGEYYTDEHDHLFEARIGVVWSNCEYRKGGMLILGQAEKFFPQGNTWSKERHRSLIKSWFGWEPDFLLTFYSVWAARADHVNFSATVDHELFHCGQALDDDGERRFRRDGSRVYCINGHPVEEFPQVVRRFGVGACSPAVAELVEAARLPPLIAPASIVAACGTCRM